MTEEDRRRVLLVGLEDGLLWQLTRSLVHAEPRIEYHCALDFSLAKELSADTFFHYIVLDGWMQSWQAGYSMGWEEFSSMKPWKWIILVDSLPLGRLLDERIQENAVFLEKPFNPKEFPAFLRNLETGVAREALGAAERTGNPSLPVEPGESYRIIVPAPDAGEMPLEATGGEPAPGQAAPAPAPGEDASQDDFHACLERGFSFLSQGDPGGARTCWERALSLRPDDRRVRANLARLDLRRRPSA